MRKVFEKSIELARAMFPISIEERAWRRCIHFSFLFKKTKLMLVAENKQSTHTVNRFNLKEFDISQKHICSECRLFLKAKSKFYDLEWRKLTLVNVRINLNGEICNSKACFSCQNLIKYISPGAVFHTTDSGGFEEFTDY